MAQQFHKFRGETLELAHRAMRKKLGEEAIVLRTATVTEGGVLGMMGKKLYEITASAPSPNPVARQLSAVERRYLTSASDAGEFVPYVQPKAPSDTARANPGRTAGERRNVEETVAYFEKLVRDAQDRIGAAPAAETAGAAGTSRSGALSRNASRTTADPADIRGDVSRIREMLQVMLAETPGAGLPPEYVPQYRRLLDRGVTRELAADLVSAAATCDDNSPLRDEKIFHERMKMHIRKRIRTSGGIKIDPGQRKVVALVGPTGVGKTTNLAKLAALFSVTEQAKVGLITSDTYRVAATDHLRVYANIIGLDMQVVQSTKQAASAIQVFEDRDLILIDTAGGSPFNDEQMGDVQGILEGAAPNETLLLISAATPLDDMRTILERFACLRPTSLLFTKLDETRRYGALLNMAVDAGVPLSYFSIGQNVPDDIVPAHVGMVADLVLEDEAGGRASTKTA